MTTNELLRKVCAWSKYREIGDKKASQFAAHALANFMVQDVETFARALSVLDAMEQEMDQDQYTYWSRRAAELLEAAKEQ